MTDAMLVILKDIEREMRIANDLKVMELERTYNGSYPSDRSSPFAATVNDRRKQRTYP